MKQCFVVVSTDRVRESISKHEGTRTVYFFTNTHYCSILQIRQQIAVKWH